MKAAAHVAANVEELNQFLENDLREPIRFGIGIHGGEVIVGDIGYRDHMVFTALGDAVNVAARLQDMTKSLAARSSSPTKFAPPPACSRRPAAAGSRDPRPHRADERPRRRPCAHAVRPGYEEQSRRGRLITLAVAAPTVTGHAERAFRKFPRTDAGLLEPAF